MKYLCKLSVEALDDEIKSIESNNYNKLLACQSRCLRHLVRCLAFLLGFVEKTQKTASYSPYESHGGANFGLATDNLDMDARVWSYEEDEDFLEKGTQYNNMGGGQGEPGKAFYKNMSRYNPEYLDGATTYGVYYVWDEPRRTPYDWRSRFIDGVYPMNPALKP